MPVICFSIFTGPILGLYLIVMEEEVTTRFLSLIQGLEYTKVGPLSPPPQLSLQEPPKTVPCFLQQLLSPTPHPATCAYFIYLGR